MLIIAHRGNMVGPDEDRENKPQNILRLLSDYPDPKLLFEIDVWYFMTKQDNHWVYYLGHNNPTSFVPETFLTNPRIICHAKDIKTFQKLLQIGAHCFMHDKDEAALTSRGWIWKYPEILNQDGTLMGICTDYAKEFLFSLR